MKTTKKKSLRRSSTIAIYMNVTPEFKKELYEGAERFGLSASKYAGMCFRYGQRELLKRFAKPLQLKKLPATPRKKVSA